MDNFEKLFEKLNEGEGIVPDWIHDAIELYLQAFESGEVEGEPAVEDVLDFIVSTNPDKEFTDELRRAAVEEIETYLPLSEPEETADVEDENEFDDLEDLEHPEPEAKKLIWAKPEDIIVYEAPDGKWSVLDDSSGEILAGPFAYEDMANKAKEDILKELK